MAPAAVNPAPLAAQAAAVQEAMALAKAVTPPPLRMASPTLAGREVFIPKAPVEPRIEMKAAPPSMGLPLGEPVAKPAPVPVAEAPAPEAPKSEGRLSLFARYRNLTGKKAIALMLAQPSMIKRPVLERSGRIMVGFRPEDYERLL